MKKFVHAFAFVALSTPALAQSASPADAPVAISLTPQDVHVIEEGLDKLVRASGLSDDSVAALRAAGDILTQVKQQEAQKAKAPPAPAPRAPQAK